MENLNNIDKSSDNAEKELRISDVSGSDIDYKQLYHELYENVAKMLVENRQLKQINKMKYENLKDAISQLEMPNYQTEDGFHNLKNNAAFIQLKELSEIHNVNLVNPNSDVIEELKSMSNNYQVLNGQYVISKNVLDVFIQHLESLSV